MFSNIGTTELIIIGIVLLVLFGSKKLNTLARGLGESSKELKSLKKEYTKAVSDEKSKGVVKQEKADTQEEVS